MYRKIFSKTSSFTFYHTTSENRTSLPFIAPQTIHPDWHNQSPETRPERGKAPPSALPYGPASTQPATPTVLSCALVPGDSLLRENRHVGWHHHKTCETKQNRRFLSHTPQPKSHTNSLLIRPPSQPPSLWVNAGRYAVLPGNGSLVTSTQPHTKGANVRGRRGKPKIFGFCTRNRGESPKTNQQKAHQIIHQKLLS